MSKTAVSCSAVMIAFLAAATAAQAQTHESDIPNLASASFGWQHGFDGLNFQRVEGKVAPTVRGPVLPGIERLADDQNRNLTPWASAQVRMHNELVKKGHRAITVLAGRHPRSIAVSSAPLFHPDTARGLDDLGARSSGAPHLSQPRAQSESEALLVWRIRRPLRQRRACHRHRRVH